MMDGAVIPTWWSFQVSCAISSVRRVVLFNTVSREAGTPILVGVRHTGNLSLHYQAVLHRTCPKFPYSSYFSAYTSVYYF